MGWFGSFLLDEWISECPCGLDTELEANQSEDPVMRDMYLDMSKQDKDNWQCPCAGYQLQPTTDHLDLAHQQGIGLVQIHTRAKGLTTCPKWYVYQKHAQRASSCYRLMTHGELSTLYPDAPKTLIDAVQCVEVAVKERTATESKRYSDDARRKSEEMAMKREHD